MLNVIGQAFLWLGFLGASCAAVWNLENEENSWATIPWQSYVASIGLGALGVVALRISAASHREEGGRVTAEFSTLRTSLDAIQAGIAELRDAITNDDPQGIVDYIDDCLVEPFNDFADARNALVQRFGLQGFAEVMTPFASAERFVNRAWSAAADGYIGEAVNSLTRAHQYVEQADAKMRELDTPDL